MNTNATTIDKFIEEHSTIYLAIGVIPLVFILWTVAKQHKYVAALVQMGGIQRWVHSRRRHKSLRYFKPQPGQSQLTNAIVVSKRETPVVKSKPITTPITTSEKANFTLGT